MDAQAVVLLVVQAVEEDVLEHAVKVALVVDLDVQSDA